MIPELGPAPRVEELVLARDEDGILSLLDQQLREPHGGLPRVIRLYGSVPQGLLLLGQEDGVPGHQLVLLHPVLVRDADDGLAPAHPPLLENSEGDEAVVVDLEHAAENTVVGLGRVGRHEVSVGRVDDCPVGLDRHLSVRGLGSDGSNRIWKGSIRILVVVKGWNGDRRVGKGLVFIIIW